MGVVTSAVAPVVASTMNAIDSYQRVENPIMKKIREQGVVTAVVEEGDGYLIRRSVSAKNKTREEMNTMYASEKSMPLLLQASCAKFANNKALGYRTIVKTEKEKIVDEKGKEKMWEFLHLSETSYMTYKTLWEKIVGFANGLKELGIEPGHKVAIYEETRWEWLVACYGIWSLGGTVVTVYANLGDDALIYALNESQVDTVVCNAKQVDKLVKLAGKSNVKLNAVIATDLNEAKEASEAKIVSFDSVVSSGAGKEVPSTMSSSPDDLALIMYTSGTTGDPKGVMLTHGNALSAVNSLDVRLQAVLGGEENPTYCAYLPLAHILEFAAENVMLKNGLTLGYGNPRTLTNTSAKPHGDLQEFKPNFFVGVPRIFDTIKKAVEGKLPPVGSMKRQIFDRAFAERREAIKQGLDTPFFSRKVFGEVANALGGRCKFIISGGAPLSAKTQEWMTVIFGCFCGQGYGLTETGAATTVQEYYNYTFENAGKLLTCCEIKLRTVDEFKVTDSPPRGEILIRGPTIAKGYYKQDAKTKEAFLEDGFFATGDVGTFAEDGTLKIVGRTKALAKNAMGEYIAMEALESMYVQNNLVLPNGICVVVDSLEPFIVGVALTDESKCMAFCQDKGIQGTWPAVLEDKKFREAALASLAQTAKENGKKPFEMFKNIRFYADEWNPENGILTAAMKLKRREIDAKYGADIKAMFNESK